MAKLRKTIYFSEETWDLIQDYNYRYCFKHCTNSHLIDYICRSYISAEKKRYLSDHGNNVTFGG